MSSTPLSRRSVLALIAVAGAVVVVIAAAVLLAPGPAYDVRGEADVPYDAGTVKEVRVLDSVTVYVDGERKPGPSVIGGIALIVLATAAFMTAIALWLSGAARRLRTFYLLAAAALGYAGLDELFAIHESIGHNLQFLADVPGISRPDDLVIALYLIPAAAFAYVFRDVLLSSRQAALALGAALGLFALSTAGDLLGKTTVEEYLELCSGICIAAGLGMLMFWHLRRHLQPQTPVLDHLTAVEAAEPRVRRFPRRAAGEGAPVGRD
jgi:hypothetical protein